MSIMNKNFDSEKLSGIAYFHDATSVLIIPSTGLDTAGAPNTCVAILDISRYSKNTLYIDSTGGPATNAGTTGLTIFFETRPASSAAWVGFRAESGVEVSGPSAFNIIGSGITSNALSGVSHFKDIRITIQNTTDSSGTATVQAWVFSRTPGN